MSRKKEKLLEVLEKRHYKDLPENVFSEKSRNKRSSKAESKKATEKKKIDAIRRFQTFSGLPATGRVNKATVEQTKKPSCSFPDVSTKEIIALSILSSRWSSTNIKYSFRNFTNQITRPDIKVALQRAFDKWKEVFPPFQFRRVEEVDSPQIVIRFVTGSHSDGFPFSGGDGDLAHAFPPNSSSLAGQIHFDDAESWSLAPIGSEKDLFTVAVHEIGHALGLGHTDSEESWMFKDYTGVRTEFAQEDIDNITNLYS